MPSLQLAEIDKFVAGTQEGDSLFFYCELLSQNCVSILYSVANTVRKMRDMQLNTRNVVKILRRTV